jgi:hypothetical protein
MVVRRLWWLEHIMRPIEKIDNLLNSCPTTLMIGTYHEVSRKSNCCKGVLADNINDWNISSGQSEIELLQGDACRQHWWLEHIMRSVGNFLLIINRPTTLMIGIYHEVSRKSNSCKGWLADNIDALEHIISRKFFINYWSSDNIDDWNISWDQSEN